MTPRRGRSLEPPRGRLSLLLTHGRLLHFRRSTGLHGDGATRRRSNHFGLRHPQSSRSAVQSDTYASVVHARRTRGPPHQRGAAARDRLDVIPSSAPGRLPETRRSRLREQRTVRPYRSAVSVSRGLRSPSATSPILLPNVPRAEARARRRVRAGRRVFAALASIGRHRARLAERLHRGQAVSASPGTKPRARCARAGRSADANHGDTCGCRGGPRRYRTPLPDPCTLHASSRCPVLVRRRRQCMTTLARERAGAYRAFCGRFAPESSEIMRLAGKFGI